MTVLVDVLRGSQSKRIQEAKLDDVKEYGALTGLERDDLDAMIRFLIDNEFIHQTKGLYPVLHPTYNSRNLDQSLTVQKLKKLYSFLSDGE